MPASFASDLATRRAFLERARSLAALSHPNVTTLFDVGQHDGRVFLVFEFLKGQPLRAEMAGRPMKVRSALELAIQMADAISDAHAAGFIHGGLSPDSIIITARGHAKIPLFELTSRAGFERGADDVRLRDYESPEEARGQTADERSDIYSVGAVLYEMLTARRPMHRGASAPSSSNRHVIPEIDEVVLKAVHPNPDSRIQTAVSLAAELRAAMAILDARGAADDDEERMEASKMAIGRVFVLAGLILAAVALVAWWWLRS
jgi:serine/threonine protein kinase